MWKMFFQHNICYNRYYKESRHLRPQIEGNDRKCILCKDENMSSMVKKPVTKILFILTPLLDAQTFVHTTNTHTDIHPLAQAFMHTKHTQTYIHMHRHSCTPQTHTDIHPHAQTFMHTKHTQTSIHMHRHPCTPQTHTHTHTHIHPHVCICTHTHTHTHWHTDTPQPHIPML